MAISVVVHGDANDKATLQTAVRFAAREHTTVRLVLGEGCSERDLERHLHFCRWDCETRLGLPAPKFVVERPNQAIRADTVTPAATEGATRPEADPSLKQLLRKVQGFLLPAGR